MPHVARKRFGQHFLRDDAVVARIVDAVDPQPGDAVVEIGPGLGALTRPLRARAPASPLVVIEIDRDLAARWRREAGVRVVEADVLTVDFAALAAQAGRALRVVGNLPYNISTPILFRLLDAAPAWSDAHLMLQKEVVARMAASPGGRDYGRLSVMLQVRCAVRPLFDVPPGAFEPPPQVDSSVVRLVPRPPPEGLDLARLGGVVALAFSQRRKLLRHTLGRWIDDERVDAGGFDVQRRAEEVPVAEYVALARAPRQGGGHGGDRGD